MKKLMYAAALMGVLLCGCSADNPFKAVAPDFDKSYSVDAKIKFNDSEAAAKVTRNSAGDWQFVFTEPEAVNGMELLLNSQGMTASLGELSISAEPTSVYTMLPGIIADSLDLLPEANSESITESEGVLKIETELDSRRVTVTADKSGELISLKCPYHKLSVYFSGQENSAAVETTEPDEGSISLE